MYEHNLIASIVIPTVDRRDSLVRCILAAARQRHAPQATEIVIVDNSPDGRQRWVLDAVGELDGSVDGGIRLVHMPHPGLAHARNCGVASARGEFLAFVDDDEAPAEDWLAAHLRALRCTSGDASFGPVTPVFDFPAASVSPVARQFYTKKLKAAQYAEVGAVINKLTSANVCFRARTCFDGNSSPFDPRFNRTGGEDTELFRRLATSGRRLIWASDAVVSEFVPAFRTNFEYLAQRRFSQGQIRTYSQIATSPKRYDRAAFWMAVGAAQFAYHRALGLLASMSGRGDAALAHRIHEKGGLGKIFWQSKFRDLRYGQVDGS